MTKLRVLGAALLSAASLLLSVPSGLVQPAMVAAEGGEGDSRPNLTDALGSVNEVLSSPIWLINRGLDPRRQKLPEVNARGGSRASGLESGMAAPSQQVGGGVLVPFRNPAPSFSRNVLLTRDFSNAPIQTEPSIAVDPTDSKHLIAGVIDYNFPTVSAYTSFDAGETWQGPYHTPFLRNDDFSGGDPALAFDRKGNAYFASISIGTQDFDVGNFAATAEISSISLSTSSNGGTIWSDSVPTAQSGVSTNLRADQSGRVRGQVLLAFLDKPWMTIGESPTRPEQDIMYVTYTEFVTYLDIYYIDELPAFAASEVQSTIKLVRSEDGGKTWSDPVAVSPTVRRASGTAPGPGTGHAIGFKRVVQGSSPAVSSDGTVYVAWMDSTDDDSQKGLAEEWIARSDDSGKTFSPPIRAVAFREPGFTPRTQSFRSWATAFPHISTGTGDEVYMVYGGLNPGKPSDDGDVFFTRSTDRGDTWSRPKRLGGDDSDSLQFFPALAVDPKGGLHVMWGDMRDDPARTHYNIYYTESQDKGDTWGFDIKAQNIHADDTRVTDFPSNPNMGFRSGLFIGDYFNITATADEVYMVWADTRLGEFGGVNQKIAFARRRAIQAPSVFLSPPAGPGGQQVTLQGFNLQPNLNVFIQVGGETVTTERTNADGRFTSTLFIPVSGKGAQDVRVIDESGNVATASFFTEFGFGSIRDNQQSLDQKVQSLSQNLDTQLKQQQAQMTELGVLVRAQSDHAGLAWWVILIIAVGSAGIGASLTGFAIRLMRP